MSLQEDIKKSILEFSTKRGINKTFCPSEVARQISPAGWENIMEEVRKVGYQMTQQGIIVITQKGKKVDMLKVKGPIRFKAL